MKKIIAAIVVSVATLAPASPALAANLRHDHRCFEVGTRPNGRTVHHRVPCNRV